MLRGIGLTSMCGAKGDVVELCEKGVSTLGGCQRWRGRCEGVQLHSMWP